MSSKGFSADSAWKNPNAVDPDTFTNDDMETVQAAFEVAIKTVLDQYRDPALKEKLLLFIQNIVVQEKPWMWVSPEGQEHVVYLFMVDEFPRDFIMLLTYTFFSRWGEGKVKYTGLTDALSWGCAADNDDNVEKEYVLMSKDLSARLSPLDSVKKYLRANKWLAVAMLIKLFVAPSDLGESPSS